MIRIISGQYKGRKLLLPPQDHTRPTSDKVRQAAFNMLEHGLLESFDNLVVLDAFAGSGALGLEALSRGAKACYFVEKSKVVLEVLRKNVGNMECGIIIPQDIYHVAFKDPFDLVFLDPPFKQQSAYVEVIDNLIKQKALSEGAIIYTESEASNKEDILNLKMLKERVFGTIKMQLWKFS